MSSTLLQMLLPSTSSLPNYPKWIGVCCSPEYGRNPPSCFRPKSCLFNWEMAIVTFLEKNEKEISKPEVTCKPHFWSHPPHPRKSITPVIGGWLAMVLWKQNMSWASPAAALDFGEEERFSMNSNENARMWLGILNGERLFVRSEIQAISCPSHSPNILPPWDPLYRSLPTDHS